MALDEVMLDDVAAGRRPPTLRIWEWAGSAVVMGRFQSLRNEVDAQAARRHGIEVVRRISGGGAMFIEPGNTITYSITAPMTLVEDMTFRSEEHTSELQSLMRISYAVFCLKKQTTTNTSTMQHMTTDQTAK